MDTQVRINEIKKEIEQTIEIANIKVLKLQGAIEELEKSLPSEAPTINPDGTIKGEFDKKETIETK